MQYVMKVLLAEKKKIWQYIKKVRSGEFIAISINKRHPEYKKALNQWREICSAIRIIKQTESGM